MNRSILVKVLLLVLYQLCRQIFCKECTNIPPLSSHTLRYELESSENQTLKQDMYSHYYHHHVTPTDDSAWSSLFPRKMLKEEEKDDGEQRWAMLYRNIKKGIVDNNGGGDSFLKEVSLHDVRLDPGSIFGQAQQTNLEYLLMLDVDSLVWSFRKTAGLSTPGEPYGGWEKPEMELRGHFVGHYLSASAQMWASTHNETLKQKMDALVSALSACQDKLQTGYLSAFPSEFFDRFEAVKPVWAPYYTIHKILAGLLDQYTLAGNDKALKMTVWMVDYFYGRVQNVIKKYSIERHWYSLNEETGGMNDVLYKLYSVTGDDKHLLLAHLFDKPCFLGLLAVKADDISGFHANTHIPVVVGSQMRYEVTGDPLYKEIGTFFMDIVNSSHSYATGGTSVNEFWTNPKRLADTLNTENEESCTTYNMLKVSRHLFRWTKEMAYADYYERALTNGVLTVQRGRDPGVMIYMLPLSHGSSKAHSYHGWGTKYDSFWCCYGTGIESFSKLGDSIYFEEGGKTPSLYIIQYISSSLNWRAGNIFLRQEVDPIVSSDQRFRVAFTFASDEQHSSGGTATLKFRIPLWTYSDGAKASINGQDLPLLNPGNFLSISKNWSPGDKITFDLPLSIRTEAIKENCYGYRSDDRPEYSSLKAIFYGPYLLAGLSDGEWEIDATSANSISDWLTPIPPYYNSHLISLSQESGQSAFAVTISNASLKMDYIPPPGNNSAVRSTFRIIPKEDPKQLKNFTNPKDAIGKLVVLEPFNSPGMAIAHNGEGGNLVVATEYSSAAVFRLVRGLDGGDSTVSLESNDRKGCFVYSGADSENGTTIKLRCKSTSVVGNDEDGFKKGASFSMGKGFSEYDPISFVAKGKQRNFLMSPLLSLRDESYTVYFNIHS